MLITVLVIKNKEKIKEPEQIKITINSRSTGGRRAFLLNDFIVTRT